MSQRNPLSLGIVKGSSVSQSNNQVVRSSFDRFQCTEAIRRNILKQFKWLNIKQILRRKYKLPAARNLRIHDVTESREPYSFDCETKCRR